MSETIKIQRVYSGKYTLYKGIDFYYALICHDPKEIMTIRESFSAGGVYIFGQVTDEKVSGFFQALDRFFSVHPIDLGFVWIENPCKRLDQWNYQMIRCQIKEDDKWKLTAYSELKFGRYRLSLRSGLEVTCQENQFSFDIGTDGKGGYSFRLNRLMAKSGETSLTIAFNNGLAGTLDFEVKLDISGKEDAFKSIDACLKHAIPLNKDKKNNWKTGFVGVLSSPFLMMTDTQSTLKNEKNLILTGQLHPNHLCDASKTTLSLSMDVASSVTYFDTALVDTTGNPQRVQLGADAALVFEKLPSQLYFDKSDNIYKGYYDFYLGFSGAYILEEGTTEVMCGLSATEFVDFEGTDRNIVFKPNKEAFLNQYPCNGLATTAWISLPKKTKYFSQPEIAPMYAVNREKVLRIMEIPTTTTNDQTPEMPMIFYRECQLGVIEEDDIEHIERMVYKKRYELLTKYVMEKNLLEVALENEVTKKTVTPQGLMAGVIPSTGQYDWFAIAQTNVSSTGGTIPNIRFEDVGESFRMDLQNSKLFIYKDKKEDFLKEATPSEDFEVIVGGWHFMISPKEWKTGKSNDTTSMIIKYIKGKSIKELLTGTPSFDTAMRKVCDNDDKVLPQYKSFVDRIENPEFQGIVFLNAKVSTKEAPKEVAFLLKQADPNKFCAHHVVLEGNKVIQETEGTLIMEESSVQAYVDYKNDSQIVYDATMPDCSFSTTQVTLSIVNSTVASFSSVTEIAIASLYGAKAKKRHTTSGDVMILDGQSQVKEGLVEYIFKVRETCDYDLEHSGFSTIEIQKVSLSVDDTGQSGRFNFSGAMTFKSIEDCDLLSYDALQISNLLMVVPISNIAYMNYESVLLGRESFSLRPNSFGQRFAATLEKVIYENDDTPENMGFASITCPVDQSKLQRPWAGQVWRINLGSLGNLSNSSDISIQLMIAWSCGKSGPEYYVGVLLPKFVKNMDLQGIIKMGFQSIELIFIETETEATPPQYMLKLHNYTMRCLNIAIPPGSNDIFLFADGSKLGWYAAYSDGKDGE